MQGNGKSNGHSDGHGPRQSSNDDLLVPQLWPAAAATLEATASYGDRLETIITLLLAELGLDVTSQHFRDTPKRVARFYREFTQGNRAKPAEILKTFRSRNNGLIVVSEIEFFSLCPHHLLVYGGKIGNRAHVARIGCRNQAAETFALLGSGRRQRTSPPRTRRRRFERG